MKGKVMSRIPPRTWDLVCQNREGYPLPPGCIIGKYAGKYGNPIFIPPNYQPTFTLQKIQMKTEAKFSELF